MTPYLKVQDAVLCMLSLIYIPNNQPTNLPPPLLVSQKQAHVSMTLLEPPALLLWFQKVVLSTLIFPFTITSLKERNLNLRSKSSSVTCKADSLSSYPKNYPIRTIFMKLVNDLKDYKMLFNSENVDQILILVNNV